MKSCLILRKICVLSKRKRGNRSHNLGKALGEGLGHKFLYNVQTYGRKDGVFFVRCRRTYALNKGNQIFKYSLVIILYNIYKNMEKEDTNFEKKGGDMLDLRRRKQRE